MKIIYLAQFILTQILSEDSLQQTYYMLSLIQIQAIDKWKSPDIFCKRSTTCRISEIDVKRYYFY